MSVEKRIKTRGSKMFMPMNINIPTGNERFMNTQKLAVLLAIPSILVLANMYMSSNNISNAGRIVCNVVIILISQYLVRKVVFQENYYIKVYRERKKIEVTKPNIFWGITNFEIKDNACILYYRSGKTGVIARLDRGTIIGKNDEHREMHYERVSDFYRECVRKGYSLMRIDMMEIAGKDNRLDELEDMISRSELENINKLVRYMTGYMRELTRDTLYDSEYIIFYTNDIGRVDELRHDVDDLLNILINGAYINYSILNIKEVVYLFQQKWGVKYFDVDNAMMWIKPNNLIKDDDILIIESIGFKNGDEIKISKGDIKNIDKEVSKVGSMGVEVVSGNFRDKIKHENVEVLKKDINEVIRGGTINKKIEFGGDKIDLNSNTKGNKKEYKKKVNEKRGRDKDKDKVKKIHVKKINNTDDINFNTIDDGDDDVII